MSGPKHLWSGDWEEESQAANRRAQSRPPRPARPEEPRPSASEPPGRRRSPSLPLLVVAALALVAGVAFGLNSLVSGGRSHAATTTTSASAPPSLPFPTVPQQTTPAPQQAPPQTNPPTAATTSGPIVYWDGMQIQTISPGLVIIDTVRLGSLADQAGLEPGDQLIAVDGHQLINATDIGPAIKGLSAGKRIAVQVAYGSSTPQTVVLTLGAPPSRHP